MNADDDVAKPMEDGSFVELPGGSKLSVWEAGAGAPIVFLHGFPASGRVWVRQLDSELATSYRLLAPDLPGFGKSPVRHPLTVAELATSIREFLDVCDLSDVLLVGWSLGGGVLMSYVEQFESYRLAGLCIVDDCPRLLPGEGWRAGKETPFTTGLLEEWRELWISDRRAFARQLSETEFKEPNSHREDIEWLVAEAMRADSEVLAILEDVFSLDF